MGPTAELSGQQLGTWRVEEKIGAGGQGAVYRARRVEGGFDQTVAIKVLDPRTISPVAARQFEEEMESLAALNHPFIAKLLGTGATADGRAYCAMEYVDGKPIDVFANERGLSIDQRLSLFNKVSEAVAYAHRHLIIHLDLKPANILVTRDGNPKLLDFGLARRVGDTALRPVAHEMDAFSRPYASPEQVTPGSPVSTLSDVYSLGAVLYELLTGHPPLRLDGLAEEAVIRTIREEEPLKPSVAAQNPRSIPGPLGKPFVFPAQKLAELRASSPGELRRKLQGDLDNVVLVSLRKEERRRYPSVEELVRDIERHLAGKRVHAKPSSPAYSAVGVARRSPMVVVAVVLLLCAMFASTALPRAIGETVDATRREQTALSKFVCESDAEIRARVLPELAGLETVLQNLGLRLAQLERAAGCPGDRR